MKIRSFDGEGQMDQREVTHRTVSRSDNVFGLPKPDLYSCSVESYRAGLSDFRIYVYKNKKDEVTEPVFELVFNSPFYFHGPFGWTGANFRIADESKKTALGRQLGWLADTDQIDAAKYLEELTLFEVEIVSTEFTVQILASSAFRVDR